MKYILSGLALFFTLISNAQQSDTTCDCKVAFEDLIQKVEDNYIALAQMRIDDTAKVYDDLVLQYRNKAKAIKGEDCTNFLQDFLTYFNDGHMFVFESPKFSEEELAANKKRIKSQRVNIQSVLKTLKYQKNMVEKNGLDGIIGKWSDGDSEIVIIKDEGFYRAYIIGSKLEGVEPGELKAEFEATEVEGGIDGTFNFYNYSTAYKYGGIYKDATLINIAGITTWTKLGLSENREISMIHKDGAKLPTIKKIDDKNTLISIPSFSYSSKSEFEKILTEYADLLKSTTTLIFDIRGNGGGSGSLYFDFISYYAERPKSSNQGKVLASKANLDYFEKFAERGQKASDVYGPVADRIKNNIGKIVDGPQFPSRKFPETKSKIKNVAILIDNGCMSAAESFILHSKKVSSKVTTFGRPTMGGIDYTSINVLPLESGKQNILFGYPTGTWHKKVFPENGGYNKTGIIPDIPIDKDVEDKVQFIINYFNE
nr:S41 family peptidase [uncultured Psychroserpens sp.]